ncbi:methyltransferase [Endozoicomonas sp.]|uniref:methyltransferase n=1 Tax=Endozoicomonas sp. TaxID=1892382 RepID=UPI00383B0D8D
MDTGAGTGLLSLMPAQNSKAKITAVELDGEASKQAESNFSQSLWADQLHLVNSSIQTFSATSAQRFDCIISNPPFFQQAFNSLVRKSRRAVISHTGIEPVGGMERVIITEPVNRFR